MEGRRSEYDVTNRVNVTDVESVCNEVCRLFTELYPKYSMRSIRKAFQIVSDLFRGDYPGYRPCDTPYHDLQHTLIFSSPKFFKHVLEDRLGQVMSGVHSYAQRYFNPHNDYYQEALERNYDYLKQVVELRDISLLRRKPSWTLVVDADAVFHTV